MKPHVSIIIPAWNAEKWIDETIASVVAQTFTDWELIVVNDGSTDLTEEKIKKHLADSRIQLVNQTNSGVASARNKGLSEAKGELISFLDADDKWLPENLEKKIDALEKNPSAGFAYSNMFRFTTELKISEPAKEGDLLRKLLLWDGEVIPTPCSNILVRRLFFDQGIKFDPNFSTAADQDFIFHLTAKTKGVLIKEPLLIYRMLPESMSRNIANLEKDHLAVYKKAAQEKLFHSWFFKQHCFGNLYLILAGNWWVNGKNKKRGFYFIIQALICYPPLIGKLVNKLFTGKNK